MHIFATFFFQLLLYSRYMFFSRFDKRRQHKMKQKHFILTYFFLIYHISNVLRRRKWCVKSEKKVFLRPKLALFKKVEKKMQTFCAVCTIKTTIFSERLVTKNLEKRNRAQKVVWELLSGLSHSCEGKNNLI